MIVYGDSEQVAWPGEVLTAIRRDLDTYVAHPGGLAAHSLLVDAFIATAELVQGAADAEMAAAGGSDVLGPAQRAGTQVLMLLARQLAASWRNSFHPAHGLPPGWQDILPALDTGLPLRLRRAEGYLHYALYPEGYLEAAARSGLGSDTCVIGLRSIGTGLAALVAAGLGTDGFFTLRPVGHPFDRHVTPAEPLARAILSAGGTYAIVDEGPGKSGSSFAGVASWLEANGVPRDRVHFFPGHAGAPGEQAGPTTRTLWRDTSRHVSGYSGAQLAGHLSHWLTGLIGPLNAPLRDLSGGGWRGSHPAPADRQMEKLKFLAAAGGRRYLVRFAGLGASGRDKLARARLLAQSGHVPEPVGLAHGFLVENWIEGHPLPATDFSRARLVDLASAYLGARARLLPADTPGASLAVLAEMAAINLGERLGPGAESAVRTSLPGLDGLQHRVRPVFTDNRLQPWEWLVDAGGRLLKTDALDHATGHDLIGPQDIAWDVAGLVAEFDLAPHEHAQLIRAVGSSGGHDVDPDLVRLLLPCYLGFQIGLWTDALGRAGGEDHHRIAALLDRHAERATRLLAAKVAGRRNDAVTPEFAAQPPHSTRIR
jgi:hypothetical protein